MSVKSKRVVVISGSRGLGLGMVEARLEAKAKVWVVARDVATRDPTWERLGIEALSADITDASAATHRVRSGAEAGMFFTIYARHAGIHLALAWLDDKEVIAVFEKGPATRPSHIMWLEWRDGQILSIHDYRYTPYIAEGVELFDRSRQLR